MRIVITQPMFFPWIGLFEQIMLAEVVVFYDDVQYSRGGVINRIQLKTPDGYDWMTIPVSNHLGQKINETFINNRVNWREKNLRKFIQYYHKAPFFNDAYQIIKKVLEIQTEKLSEIIINSMLEICRYYKIEKEIRLSSSIGLSGRSSDRVLNYVKHYKGTTYITGHGAKNYLNHELFEENGIIVEYINYEKKSYPQLHGEFNPYVSILDLIANTGKDGKSCMLSKSMYWKSFLNLE